jgi:hypothetical protein
MLRIEKSKLGGGEGRQPYNLRNLCNGELCDMLRLPDIVT